MSQAITYSRGALYESYRKSDLVLAKRFLGNRYSLSILSEFGTCTLVASLICTAILIGIVGGVTHGFRPTSTPGFYSTMFPIIGGVGGSGIATGIVMLAIRDCKRRNILAERLTAKQINTIAGMDLLSPSGG